MLREHIRKEVKNNICFVCKKEFTKDDDTVLIFDKAFGGNVKIHRCHHHDDINSTLKSTD